jgi:hypothetical protein
MKEAVQLRRSSATETLLENACAFLYFIFSAGVSLIFGKLKQRLEQKHRSDFTR